MTFTRLLTLPALAGLTFAFIGCQPKAEETIDPETTEMTDADAVPEATPESDAPVAEPEAAASTSYDTTDSKVSYGVGYNLGRQIGGDPSIEVDLDALKAGLEDGIGAVEPKLAEDVLRAAFAEIQARSEAAAAAGSDEAMAAGTAFLAANATRPEVTVTESGLQYEVLTAGEGESPSPANTVEVHYHGTLMDGTVFDSSVDRGETIEFPVTGVIQGWVEALQLMKVGDKWKLFIPYDLAYGPRGQGQIPPYAPLVFEVELISIK